MFGQATQPQVWESEWEEVGQLGSGARGPVLLVKRKRDTGDVERSALKRSTREEVDALNALSQCRNIISLQEAFAGTVHDEIWVRLEWMEGGSLRGFLRVWTPGKVPADISRFLLGEVLCGLEGIHRRGWMHRDVKAENIGISVPPTSVRRGECQVKLLDFDVATPVPDGGRLYEVVGTVENMAPEVYEGSYDEKADCWSVGVVAYEILFGYRPFNDASMDRVEEMVRNWQKYLMYPYDAAEATQSFVQGLLANLGERSSASRAGRHYWLRGGSGGGSLQLPMTQASAIGGNLGLNVGDRSTRNRQPIIPQPKLTTSTKSGSPSASSTVTTPSKRPKPLTAPKQCVSSTEAPSEEVESLTRLRRSLSEWSAQHFDGGMFAETASSPPCLASSSSSPSARMEQVSHRPLTSLPPAPVQWSPDKTTPHRKGPRSPVASDSSPANVVVTPVNRAIGRSSEPSFASFSAERDSRRGVGATSPSNVNGSGGGGSYDQIDRFHDNHLRQARNRAQEVLAAASRAAVEEQRRQHDERRKHEERQQRRQQEEKEERQRRRVHDEVREQEDREERQRHRVQEEMRDAERQRRSRVAHPRGEEAADSKARPQLVPFSSPCTFRMTKVDMADAARPVAASLVVGGDRNGDRGEEPNLNVDHSMSHLRDVRSRTQELLRRMSDATVASANTAVATVAPKLSTTPSAKEPDAEDAEGHLLAAARKRGERLGGERLTRPKTAADALAASSSRGRRAAGGLQPRPRPSAHAVSALSPSPERSQRRSPGASLSPPPPSGSPLRDSRDFQSCLSGSPRLSQSPQSSRSPRVEQSPKSPRSWLEFHRSRTEKLLSGFQRMCSEGNGARSGGASASSTANASPSGSASIGGGSAPRSSGTIPVDVGSSRDVREGGCVESSPKHAARFIGNGSSARDDRTRARHPQPGEDHSNWSEIFGNLAADGSKNSASQNKADDMKRRGEAAREAAMHLQLQVEETFAKSSEALRLAQKTNRQNITGGLTKAHLKSAREQRPFTGGSRPSVSAWA